MDYLTDHYVVINRETMKFVSRAPSMDAATKIANLEPVDASFVMISLDRKSGFSKFGILELMLLYKNTTGQVYTNGIHDYPTMVQECFKLATVFPMDTRTEAELEKQHDKLPPLPPGVIGSAGPIVVRTDPNAPVTVDYVKVTKVPSAPKEPGAKPSKGSTGRVWDIADQVRAEMGGASVDKNMRKLIIERCEAAGINGGTAATQFGKWKATQS